MNIGFIAPQISLSKGGIQAVSYLLADEMPKKVDFHTFCAKDSDVIDDSEKVTYCTHKQCETIGVHTELIRNVFKSHNNKPYDFTMAALYSYGLPCYLLKKIKKVPYGILVHGNELMEEPRRKGILGNLLVSVKKYTRRKIFNDADIVIANSNYTSNLYEKNFGGNNSIVINPPVNYVDHGSGISNNKNKIILSVGRIVERKGFQNVIRAMGTLKSSFPDLKYFIAGDGPYACELNKLVKELQLEENVFLLGRVTEEKKDELYKDCDYFIMPSYIIEKDAEVEGFGIVYIEANMYGKYVIATKTGGIQDAVIEGKTGEFVEPNNVESIVNMLKRIYSKDFNYAPTICVDWAKQFAPESISDIYVETISKFFDEKLIHLE